MEAGARVNAGPRRRRANGLLVAAGLLAVVLVGLGAGVAIHRLSTGQSASTPATAASKLHGQATWGPGVRPAPAITTLVDQTGHRFTLASLRGHTVVMEFFDSHCRQECPLAGRALAAAERSLPRAQRPVLVVVSVNPLDTQASTRAAIRSWGLAGLTPWHWLRGNHAHLASVWADYHIFVKPMKGDISHTEALYLIDGQGYERSGYLYPYLPDFVADDLRTLSKAGQRGGRGD
jgi:cytochrome oxidase Cu insertion factor (SCO1/SenC/PrrC family)